MTTRDEAERFYLNLPERWEDVVWPGWMPQVVVEQISAFWDGSFGRSPKSWGEAAMERGAPPLGHIVNTSDFQGEAVSGSFVYMWNNIGRVIENGEVKYVSFSPYHTEKFTVSYDEWVQQGTELFGEDKNLWALECPGCAKIFTIGQVRAAGCEPAGVGFHCIGRYDTDVDCSWTAFGLLGNLGKGVAVQTAEGAILDVFPFAHTDVRSDASELPCKTEQTVSLSVMT